MKYRTLRIAWSVTWGVAAVLLCVLWVRSNSHDEGITRVRTDGTFRSVFSTNGAVCLYRSIVTPSDPEPRPNWLWFSGGEPMKLFHGFGYSFEKGMAVWYFHAPHWLLILFGTSAAALPWIRNIKWRFSLRTLLIATTLVAVVLGLIVRAIK